MQRHLPQIKSREIQISCQIRRLLIIELPFFAGDAAGAGAFAVIRLLALDDIAFSAQHPMFNVDLGDDISWIRADWTGSKLTVGPLNHLRASTIHQVTAISMSPPYTRHVQFMLDGL